MGQIYKQSVGIDISMKTFDACVCKMDMEQVLSFTQSKKFDNTKTGFKELLLWVEKQTQNELPVNFIMEATGIYYEEIAYYLHQKGYTLHVLLPNKSHNFFASLNAKSKTDKIDSRLLAQFGVERKFEPWQPASPFFKQLRSLTRYYSQLTEQKTVFMNMKHSHNKTVGESKFVLQNINQVIKNLEKQLTKCKQQIDDLIKSEPEIKEKVDNICSIKGVRIATAATIIAETLGFHLFNNNKQLVSYAGYDVVENQSGTSVKGKTRISKKGNKYIRKALYFPAISYAAYNQPAKLFYERILERRKIKMVGYVAVQRKLLILIFTLWKNNKAFDIKKVTST